MNVLQRLAAVPLLVTVLNGPSWTDVKSAEPALKHGREIFALSVGPKGDRIVIGDAANAVTILDGRTGKSIRVLQSPVLRTCAVPSVTVSGDGKRIVSGHIETPAHGAVRVWDADSGKELFSLSRTTDRFLAPVYGVAISRDGKTIAATNGKNVDVWDAASGKLLHSLAGHQESVTCVAFSPDGRRLVSGSADKSIRMWCLETARTEKVLEGHEHWVFCIAFMPDGRRLVSGSYDKTLRVWDRKTGHQVASLQGHTGRVLAVGVSADGKTIVSGGDDKTVRLWDVTSGKNVHLMKGHTEAVTCIAFSADGKSLFSGSHDRTLRIWDATSGKERRFEDLPQ